MVVKTDLCAFSETRVYPGKGRRFVTRNGQMVVLGGSKVDSMYHQRKKPAKLHWTQSWRRMNKKLSNEATAKRKARKVVKTIAQRAVSGRDAEETNKLKKEVAPKPAAVPGAEKLKVKHDLIQAAKAQAKKAKLAAKEKKKAAGPAQQKAAPAAKTHAGKGR